MSKLINTDGTVNYGIFPNKIDEVNYTDFRLETSLGLPIPKILKKVLANQFHYTGFFGPEFIVGLAVVDLKYLTNGFFFVYDRKEKKLIETKKLKGPSSSVIIRPTPENPYSVFKSKDLTIEMNGNKVFAETKDITVEAKLELATANPLRICTRTGYRGWVFTQKTMPIATSGKITFGGKSIVFNSPEYWGLSDWTTGHMRRDTYWSWASTAIALKDGRSLGLNLCCGVNDTSFTENAFWLDGKMTKVDTVHFAFDTRDFYKKWRITSYDKKVDLTFNPEKDRGELVYAGFVASRFTQLMGTFDGTLTTDTGEVIEIKGLPGIAEDHFAKW